jgi:CRP/FNR family transcriptional regulator, cyclic AMP receptor protein
MSLAAPDREALIAACPLFRGLDADGMAAVAKAAVEVEFPAERTIARQGEIGTGLFILAGGSVRVVRDGEIIARLGPGEFFGELSVLDGGPRNASVITDAPTTCLALATWDAERVLREQPGVALAVLRVLAARLREATADHRT